MINFDLMKQKPILDIPTLNYIWDNLWRSNYTNRRKNERERSVYYEHERIMQELLRLANEQIEE